MITAVVRFKLPKGTMLADAKAKFETTAPRYRGLNGLARKYYLFDAEASTGGGCYLFESRAAAEAILNDDWRARIRANYGADPEIDFFETPVIVENVHDR